MMIKSEAQLFEMERLHDESGVSGTGIVLDGVRFPSGKVVVCWRGSTPSVAVYESWDDFYKIHILSHPSNGTIIHWKNNN